VNYLNQFLPQDGILCLQLALIAVFFVLCVVFWQRSRTQKKLLAYYAKLMDDFPGGNLESILMQLTKAEEDNNKAIQDLAGKVGQIEGKLPRYISRVNLVRYKGFPDVGGDLSFSLAMLDQQGDGVVITSIHGREETRVYAKDIRKFVSEHALSDEEKRVIAMAREQVIR
jgi:hypothetical protein